MNLYEKIQAVSNDIKNIEKDMQVGTEKYGYKAVSDNAVTLKVKAAEKKHRLISIPGKQDIIHHEVIRVLTDESKEKITYSFLIKMTTKIVDLDNPSDFIEVESFGHGLDSGDKGFGKASTYARKYALLNAYKIATGEDPDSDPSKGLSGNKNQPLRDKVIDYMEQNASYMADVFTHYGVSGYNQLTDTQINSIAKSIQKTGFPL